MGPALKELSIDVKKNGVHEFVRELRPKNGVKMGKKPLGFILESGKKTFHYMWLWAIFLSPGRGPYPTPGGFCLAGFLGERAR